MPSSSITETARWHCRWRVEKYRDPEAGTPDDIVAGAGNLLTTAGANALWTALTGGALTAFSNANAHLGVGDATTVENAAQTDLQAPSSKFRKGMDAGYPQISGNQVAFRSTFGGGEANFAWHEFGAFSAFSGGTMLNRKVFSLGTKASGSTWVFTVTITLS